jgi:hypothetical protein
MPPATLHVIGIDPGGTTGWARFTVPRKCLFGNAPSAVLEWDHGEFYGSEINQTQAIARMVREIQSLDYQVGPALVVEDWTIMINNVTTDPESLSPVRIAAMLQYAKFRGELGDATITLQDRGIAKQTMTDERLQRAGYYVRGSDHVRDATRHAITALRRARDSDELRDEMWNARACTI